MDNVSTSIGEWLAPRIGTVLLGCAIVYLLSIGRMIMLTSALIKASSPSGIPHELRIPLAVLIGTGMALAIACVSIDAVILSKAQSVGTVVFAVIVDSLLVSFTFSSYVLPVRAFNAARRQMIEEAEKEEPGHSHG